MNSGATRLGIVKCQLNLEIGLAPDNRIALPLPGYLVCTAHLFMMWHNYTYLLGNSDLSLKGSIFVRMNELEGLFGEYHSSVALDHIKDWDMLSHICISTQLVNVVQKVTVWCIENITLPKNW